MTDSVVNMTDSVVNMTHSVVNMTHVVANMTRRVVNYSARTDNRLVLLQQLCGVTLSASLFSVYLVLVNPLLRI